MHVNDDGLQISHGLSLGGPLGIKHSARCGTRCQFRHHAHIAVKQRACHEVRIVGVERHSRHPLQLCLFGGAVWYKVKPIHLALLHRLSCLRHIGKFVRDVAHLKGIEVAGQIACGCSAVLVNKSHGQVLGQPLLHERGEKYVTEQRRDDHTEPVNRLCGHTAELTQERICNTVCLSPFRGSLVAFVYMNVIRHNSERFEMKGL